MSSRYSASPTQSRLSHSAACRSCTSVKQHLAQPAASPGRSLPPPASHRPPPRAAPADDDDPIVQHGQHHGAQPPVVALPGGVQDPSPGFGGAAGWGARGGRGADIAPGRCALPPRITAPRITAPRTVPGGGGAALTVVRVRCCRRARLSPSGGTAPCRGRAWCGGAGGGPAASRRARCCGHGCGRLLATGGPRGRGGRRAGNGAGLRHGVRAWGAGHRVGTGSGARCGAVPGAGPPWPAVLRDAAVALPRTAPRTSRSGPGGPRSPARSPRRHAHLRAPPTAPPRSRRSQ